jgi:SAM-dependent methyltransferase
MRSRRLAFGDVAELYDRARPSYPAELVDDVVGLAGLASGGRALEVGAGTGKATLLFLARGVSILGLEPSPAMAAIARRNCAGYPDMLIEHVDFEQWRGAERFPLVYSAQAWHWVTPEVRYTAARAALRDGGILATFWNRPNWEQCALRDELHDAYRSAVPEFVDPGPMYPVQPWSAERWGNWEREIGEAPGLDHAELRRYRWDRQHSTEEYLALLRTHSDHIVMESARREALLDGIAAVLERNGGGLRLSYLTLLCLARAI